MDVQRVIESLNEMRSEWLGRCSQPEFEMRIQWVQGVVKGIDLAIWVITKEG